MQSGGFPWLTLLIFLPLAGAAALFFVKETSVRIVALGITVADLLLSLPLWWLFDASSSQMQFAEKCGLDHVAAHSLPPGPGRD